MIFDVRPEKEQIYNLNNVKTKDFWSLYFSTKPPKEKFDTLCNDSINNPELEKSLSNHFNDFVWIITSNIGKDYFDSMKDITFCKICSIEINKPLLYEHFNSKEHKEIENYLIINCMTYCELCKREIRNDEWREHIISPKHLEFEKRSYCEICNMNYDSVYRQYECRKDSESFYHNNSETHRKNQERLEFNSS